MTALRHAFALLLLAWCASAALPGWAQERILSYDSRVDLHADGSMDVTERIAVRAEGQQIRRGIYREFPTRYLDRHGNRVIVDFRIVGVSRDGEPIDWFSESERNGVVVYTGNDDFLPVPADYTYTLRYRTNRQVGFFERNDELYWNAIGHGWKFAIEQATVEIHLPAPVPPSQLAADAYTGAYGARRQDYSFSFPAPGVARWRLTRPLPPGHGMTAVLTFPKGLIAEPTRQQRMRWLLNDNRGILVAVAGLLALLGYCFWRWRRVGRDPRGGPVIARYEPPAGFSPAGLRFMQRMYCDTRCLTADLLALAVSGNVRIHRNKGMLKDEWVLEKTHAPGVLPEPGEQKLLMSKLFEGADDARLVLGSDSAARMSSAQQAHARALEKHFIPAYFNRHGGSVAVAAAIACGSLLAAFLISGGGGIPIMAGIAVLMLVAVLAFAWLVRAPTAAGRRLLDEIEGLRLYLSVAERDELRRLAGPEPVPALDAKRYEQLLPYAVALDVEDAWTRKFTAAVGTAAAAAASAGIGWYRGGAINDLGSFSKTVGSSLTSQISASTHAPGSQSGAGGGGFSGGGGGGGGGGGR